MVDTRVAAALFLILVCLVGTLPNPVPSPTHRTHAHNARFPPLDDDDTREPAILDEAFEPDERRV